MNEFDKLEKYAYDLIDALVPPDNLEALKLFVEALEGITDWRPSDSTLMDDEGESQ